MDTFQNYTTVSLDSSISHSDKGEGDNNLLNTLVADEGVDQIVNSEHLKRAISFLTQREQKILHMTYFQHLQQWEISKKLNISQVHVSRLIGHALKRLKRILIREAKEDQVYSGE
jgi:RNA polymerase sigma-B factor